MKSHLLLISSLTVFMCFVSLLFPLQLIKAKETTMQKTVLILHGWPQPIEPESVNNIYLEYFTNKNYKVIAPRLFTSDFKLNSEDSKKYIKEKLEGKSPDVIVGISMGGLLAPQIASDYPKSKMVLIASNPKMSPNGQGFKTVINLAKNKDYLKILNLFKFLPGKIIFNLYEIVNPFTGNDEDRQRYVDDMKKNIKYMIDIPIAEEAEIVKFVTETDNTELLKKLPNKTLIFSGKNDLIMSINQSNRFDDLLENSILVETQGSHFEVFTEENFKELDTFLD